MSAFPFLTELQKSNLTNDPVIDYIDNYKFPEVQHAKSAAELVGINVNEEFVLHQSAVITAFVDFKNLLQDISNAYIREQVYNHTAAMIANSGLSITSKSNFQNELFESYEAATANYTSVEFTKPKGSRVSATKFSKEYTPVL